MSTCETCGEAAVYEVYAAVPLTFDLIQCYPAPLLNACGDHLLDMITVDQARPTASTGYYIVPL